MTREKMIEALVRESIDYIRTGIKHGDVGLLGDYLEFGFIGFSHMSDDELRTEYEANIEEDEA